MENTSWPPRTSSFFATILNNAEEIILPDELKLMIFKYCDLESIKSLRLASKSWASVGIDVILLPTFVFSPRRQDVQRLINISKHPTLSVIAARMITTLEFISNDWSLNTFRNVFSHRFSYTVNSRSFKRYNCFVPTEDQQKALDELKDCERDIIISKWGFNDTYRLMEALRAVPNYRRIKSTQRCIFRHPLLKKSWDEYGAGVCMREMDWRQANVVRRPEIEHILLACESCVEEGGLLPRHLELQELSMQFTEVGHFPSSISHTLRQLETFALLINGVVDFGMDRETVQEFIGNWFEGFPDGMPKLKSMSLSLACSNSEIEVSSLPGIKIWPRLESLYLGNVSGTTHNILIYLEQFRPTLKRLQLHGVCLRGDSDFKDLVMGLRDGLDLERFLMASWLTIDEDAGVPEDDLFAHCDEEWKPLPSFEGDRGDTSKSRALEKFVVEGGEWPWKGDEFE